MYSIGIDIGYSSFKYVILAADDRQAGSEYVLHHGNVEAGFISLLQKIADEPAEFYFGITGEQADRLPSLEKYRINEVTAVVEGAFACDSSLRSIIELGAQKTKYMTNLSAQDRAHMQFAINSSCSAGTGSFLEEQVLRLGISLDEYSDYAAKATSIPRIAGRCSVFSKTDMIHHQQEGVKIEDILMGLAYALVRNFKANVVQKLPLDKPVMLAGGVIHNQGVLTALQEIFQLADADIIIPKGFDRIGALGAACIARQKLQAASRDELKSVLSVAAKGGASAAGFAALGSFGKNDADNKHVCRQAADDAAYLGIDVGSTSTNLVLIDAAKNVIAYRYLRTRGNPRQAVRDGLDSLQEQFAHRLAINGIGVTGSGRNFIGNELAAAVIVDEITAQAKGAVAVDAAVDTVFEIGGQDSKYIQIENGRVVGFEMNKICAAGTGSFIEEQAKKLAIPIEDFSRLALQGAKPLDLGDRCTVFIEGNVAKALAANADKQDIAAGLAYSIVHNYLNRVVGNRPIGSNVFLQGGIAHNQAVVNAFRSVLRRNITVPAYFSVTGAYGAALLVREKLAAAAEPAADQSSQAPVQDIGQEMERLFLKGYSGARDPGKRTIGIPRVLFLHKLFPLFHQVFKTLGFNVIVSKPTDEEIVALSQQYSLDETCYPVKLINGHVAYLINQGVDYIFLPSLYTMKHDVSKAREDYACVYMQTAPAIIAQVMDLAQRGVKLLSPALSFKFGKLYMIQTLLNMGKELGKNKAQMAVALIKGMARLRAYSQAVEAFSRELVQSLQDGETAFILITRTYNTADPVLNMKIPQTLRKMGYKVLTLANIPAFDYDISADYPNMYWPFGQHILAGARIVRDMPNLYPIYITNHGCGPDTVLSHYFSVEMQGKPYLHIEVDEHSSTVGVITRLEAFVHSLQNVNKAATVQPAEPGPGIVPLTGQKMLLPNIYPYSQIICEWFTYKGILAAVLPPTQPRSLAAGKRFSRSKESLSLLALLGDVFCYLEDNPDQGIRLWLPQDEGSEVSGQYSKLVGEKLKAAGCQAEVISPFSEDLLADNAYGFDFALALLLGDLVMAAGKHERSAVLQQGLELIKAGRLSEQSLLQLSRAVYRQVQPQGKQIFVLGEIAVVFNDYLNNFQLSKLENQHRVVYQPLAEMLYCSWHDHWQKHSGRNPVLAENLARLRTVISGVSGILAEHSPFDADVAQLLTVSNQKLALYAGGHGRYRLAKALRCPDRIDGMLMVSSLYENTATILKILRDRDKDELTRPMIEIAFDGSNHGNNKELLDTFIHYL